MPSYPVRSFSYGEVSKAFAGRTDAPFYHQSCRLMEDFLPLPYGPAEKRPGSIYVAQAKANPLFDRGDCESATPPMLAGETSPTLGGCTWARDNGQFHGGSYSFKLTKTGDAPATARLSDGSGSSDMHGLRAGETYTLSFWIYIPSGGMVSPDIALDFTYYVGANGFVFYAHPDITYDQWQRVSLTVHLPTTTTGVLITLMEISYANSGKYFYVDDILLESALMPRVVLHPWVLTPTTGIMMEFGNLYIRFFKDGAPILDSGSPYEVATTYGESELSSINIRQVTSYAYITCPGHKVAKLTRTADTNWGLADVTFTVSGGTQDFSTDYPSFVELYEDRLILARTPVKLGTFYGSKTATYETFTQGTVATDAWEKTPQAKQNNEILWIVAGDAFLFGTTTGIYRVGGKESMLNPDVAWWPNVQANTGTSNVPALMVDDFVAYVGRNGRHIYRFQYQQAVDQYVADPITQLAEHLAKHIVGQVHQRQPETTLWAWTSSGLLLSGSYSRSAGLIGWAKHDLSGSDGDYTGLIESAAILPTTGEDQVWLVVKREDPANAGSYIRCIEYLADREWDELADYHGVDSAVSLDGGDNRTIVSLAASVVTSYAHGFSTDDKIKVWLTGDSAYQGTVCTVKNALADTFLLYNEAGTSALTPTGTVGYCSKVWKIVTGLSHLNGRLVKVWADGVKLGNETVASGQVTIDSYANRVHVGLGFTAALESMPVAEERNRLKQVKKIFLTFQKTADVQIGKDASHMVDVKFTYPDALYTDGADEESSAKNCVENYSRRDCTIRIGSSGPGPCKVTSAIYELGEVEK